MDTTVLSGISSATAQPAPASAKPVTPVKAPERSSRAAEHKFSPGGDARHPSKDTKTSRFASDEKSKFDDVNSTSSQQDEDSLIEIVSNSFDKGTKLKVDRDDDTGRVIFKTVVKKTGEVIRQVPSEEMIQLAKSLNMGKGLLVNKEA